MQRIQAFKSQSGHSIYVKRYRPLSLYRDDLLKIISLFEECCFDVEAVIDDRPFVEHIHSDLIMVPHIKRMTIRGYFDSYRSESMAVFSETWQSMHVHHIPQRRQVELKIFPHVASVSVTGDIHLSRTFLVTSLNTLLTQSIDTRREKHIGLRILFLGLCSKPIIDALFILTIPFFLRLGIGVLFSGCWCLLGYWSFMQLHHMYPERLFPQKAFFGKQHLMEIGTSLLLILGCVCLAILGSWLRMHLQ